jgi:hypothetical protein
MRWSDCLTWGRRLAIARLVLPLATLAACSAPPAEVAIPSGPESPSLLIFASDADTLQSDFLATIDLRAASPDRGKVVATTPLGLTNTMPHHMEYAVPPAGELLFMNAHHHELSLLVDLDDPRAVRVRRTFLPPPPLRFPHDYTRTPRGTRLVGFLRSEGASPEPAERIMPGNAGGIAEYTRDGEFIRAALAGTRGRAPVRPYAFALLPEIDRLVVTSAPMMEDAWADVIQIYRYSDFTLLRTMDLPVGRLADGRALPGSQRAGFGPRVLADGSVFLNSYGCAFYHLTDIARAVPTLRMVHTLETAATTAPGRIRGSCGIPIVFGRFWIQPAGQLHQVVVLDIADPSAPREVSRLALPDSFNPHWLARDPRSDRLVLGAELGGEEGFYILRFDDARGTLAFDALFTAEGKQGYITLKDQPWQHGPSGPAWGHAALFLPR